MTPGSTDTELDPPTGTIVVDGDPMDYWMPDGEEIKPVDLIKIDEKDIPF